MPKKPVEPPPMLPLACASDSPGAPGTGAESLLPALYRDGHVAAAVYSISAGRARVAVAPRELQPIVLPGGRALAIVSWFDYRDTSLGPYQELAVGIVVGSRRGLAPSLGLDLLSNNPDTGAWLLALPVSSALACQGGVELFGYPKTLCELRVEYSSKSCRGTVHGRSTPILGVSFHLGWGPKFPVRWLVTYSRKDGHLLRTRVKTRWQVTLCSGRGTSVEVKNPHHPLCQTLQQLELPNRPLFVLHGSQFSATLNEGERISAIR
jgi:hypothetical protein